MNLDFIPSLDDITYNPINQNLICSNNIVTLPSNNNYWRNKIDFIIDVKEHYDPYSYGISSIEDYIAYFYQDGVYINNMESFKGETYDQFYERVQAACYNYNAAESYRLRQM